MKADRKSYNSSLRPISKKRQAEIKAGLRPKKPAPRKKAQDPEVKEVAPKVHSITARSKKSLKFIEEHPLLKKTVFRASNDTRGGLMEQVDAAFSKYVRLMAVKQRPPSKDTVDLLSCFICGKAVHWKEAVLMHCEPRICMSTRWDYTNCQAGCVDCNGKPNGDRENFRAMLDKTFGPGTAEKNEIKSKNMEKVTAKDMRYHLDFFSSLNKVLS